MILYFSTVRDRDLGNSVVSEYSQDPYCFLVFLDMNV